MYKAGEEIRCIDNENVENDLTIGKIYKIIKINDLFVYIKTNTNDIEGFWGIDLNW